MYTISKPSRLTGDKGSDHARWMGVGQVLQFLLPPLMAENTKLVPPASSVITVRRSLKMSIIVYGDLRKPSDVEYTEKGHDKTYHRTGAVSYSSP